MIANLNKAKYTDDAMKLDKLQLQTKNYNMFSQIKYYYNKMPLKKLIKNKNFFQKKI